MLLHAGRLIASGLSVTEACAVALALPLSDDADVREALMKAIESCL
ncbi:MAG: CbbQ/NirQ/NorQ C-terminal domain-containing protein [Bdellovibrionales bacterium]|nr:CbbQ/NirQ/NorQ C-terminal domain-containing protein [Bdellovibrionales bacterium]